MASETVDNAVKLVGEAFIPGASRLLDGDVKEGAAHFVAGMLARMFIGPFGVLLVKANSFSRSVSGKNLAEQIGMGHSSEGTTTSSTTS